MIKRKSRIIATIFALICLAGMLLCAGCGRSRSDGGDTEEKETAEATQEGRADDPDAASVNTDKIAAEIVTEDTAAKAAESEDTSAGRTEAKETAAGQDKAKQTDTGIKTLTISATGDCTLGVTQEQGYTGSFDAYYDSYGADYFLDGVRDIFEADDLTLINLECVLSTATERVEKAYNLKGAPEYVEILTGSSVEACSLGNNHTYDYGYEGFAETQDVLDGADITYAYLEEPATFVSDEGVTVGIVSASLLDESSESVQTLKSEISTLRDEGAEVIIACCHWGIEKDYYPTEFQQTTAHELIDAGADLIIGSHPHVLQGVEVYKDRVICYSLGNFCFGGNLNPEDKNTMIFQQTFTVSGGEVQKGEIDADIIPCRLSSSDGYNDFRPMAATGDTKENIISLVNEYSAIFGTASFDGEGKLQTDSEGN